MALWLWVGFVVFILLFMCVDLMVFGRRGKIIQIKTALAWTGLCVVLALAFVPAVYLIYDNHSFGMGNEPGQDELKGLEAAARFLQGWLMEYALSVDNLFVFALIFQHFKVPREYQHRVLTWGIIATLIMRGAMIGTAVSLVEKFQWLLYLAGAFLLYTALKMFLAKEDEQFEPDKSIAVRAIRRVIPVTSEYHGERFFARQNNTVAATPLFLVLVVLNVVDLIFAVDSVPAIVGITKDSFLMFSSNMFAILGLRALYFVLAEAMDQFKYLKVSLAFILAFVGAKMLVEGLYHVHLLEKVLPEGQRWLTSWAPHEPLELHPLLSLGVIVAALLAGIIASRVRMKPA